MADNDKYTGETFRSDDDRTTNRRVRIKTRIEDDYKGRPRYRGTVITDDGNPKAVGRSVRLLAQTLDAHYTKVSH